MIWGPTFFLASVVYDVKGRDTATLVCRVLALVAVIVGWPL